jgi:hypothetical protein
MIQGGDGDQQAGGKREREREGILGRKKKRRQDITNDVDSHTIQTSSLPKWWW